MLSAALKPSASSAILSSPPRRTSTRLLAALQVTALTGLWIAAGLVLQLDSRVYLALGVPLVLVFQVLVRRRPIRDLWVRDGSPFSLDTRAAGIAALLIAYPMVALAITVAQAQWLDALMALCCLPGALAAAYAVRRISPRSWRPACRAALLATVIGVGWMVYAIVPQIPADASVGHLLLRGLHSLLLYVPVTFVLEEVSFRGAVDAHVHRPGERLGLLSAFFVSVLWALWHLPIDIGTQPLTDLVISLLMVHVSIGIPLSLAWRRSGNLALPATAHAVIDAVRDALSSGI
jgi:membrane protease YdiL (CAAX protease family)